MRLFVAVPVPPGDAFAAVTRDLVQAVPGVQPVPADTWHLTLRFLGEVEEAGSITVALQQALAGLSPVPAVVRGVGAFDDTRKARVAWAAVNAPGLIEVEARVRNATACMGKPPEMRTFVPHVTLARLPEPRDLRSWIERHADTLFLAGNFAEVVLFRSELTKGGPVYTRQWAVALGTGH